VSDDADLLESGSRSRIHREICTIDIFT